MQVQIKVQVFDTQVSRSGEWRFVKMIADLGGRREAISSLQPVKEPEPGLGFYVAEFEPQQREGVLQLVLKKLSPIQAAAKAA